ncbi:MAG: hypothetical protein RBU35_20680, partial [Anaerolineae bacterium]|nr:hypothetical protein [Anaerolineae bacterium]
MTTELKPCPICGGSPRRDFSGVDLVHCDTDLCPMGCLREAAWQALPRPEKAEEERTCRWKPDRPGDEVRILEGVLRRHESLASRPVMEDLKWQTETAIWAGDCLARYADISYPDALRARMAEAARRLGPWDVHDGRDCLREALEELLDCACYLMAEEVRQ